MTFVEGILLVVEIALEVECLDGSKSFREITRHSARSGGEGMTRRTR